MGGLTNPMVAKGVGDNPFISQQKIVSLRDRWESVEDKHSLELLFNSPVEL